MIGKGKIEYASLCSALPALIVFALPYVLAARDISVSLDGSDTNDGSASHPLKTISAAAQVAEPGDVITIHAGVYRERIDPPRGGLSDQQRIVYQAAPGEKVEIAGSEEVKNWVKAQGNTWKVTLPNGFFGSFNPYQEVIHGDWFYPKNSHQRNPGAVYLNGQHLLEADNMDMVMHAPGKTPLWFPQVDAQNTTIFAQFPAVDPNQQEVEINVRQTVFYPSKTGINYITVRGFTLRDAATPWAPPTAEQIGLIGTNWSKGWIIENNTIEHSTCAGVTLGKYGDAFANKSATAQAYVDAINRAVKNGWNRETVGSHVVRNNTISDCGQGGVVGSLGAIFSEVTGNHIYDIANNGQLFGFEQAGIKFHAAIDVLIKGNRIHNCARALWMDWMAQGVRISSNVFYRNGVDLFMEVDHGPYLVDNNLLLSGNSFAEHSDGGALVHNLFLGALRAASDGRSTPFFQAHSAAIAGLSPIKSGENRFFNNIFVGAGRPSAKIDPAVKRPGKWNGLATYDAADLPLLTGGNVYYDGAQPYKAEVAPVIDTETGPHLQILDDGNHGRLQWTVDPALAQAKTSLVTTSLLGLARVSKLPFENRDGTPLQVDIDYLGQKRNAEAPTPGPFENPASGQQDISVW